MFLLIQAAPGKPWLDMTELYDLGQPGQELPDLGDVATDAHGYATAVEPGDTSVLVAPGALSAGFSRYFDAAVTHPGSAVSGYSSYIVPLDLAADHTSPRYGWRIADVLQAASAPVYALRLTDGGAAVIYLTRESFSWTAVSATATLSAPQSAYNAAAVPFPSLTQALHVTSVRPGLRITLTELDEHLAIDPPGSGTVADYFNGKTIAWTAAEPLPGCYDASGAGQLPCPVGDHHEPQSVHDDRHQHECCGDRAAPDQVTMKITTCVLR
jgi:hypothetical protein